MLVGMDSGVLASWLETLGNKRITESIAAPMLGAAFSGAALRAPIKSVIRKRPAAAPSASSGLPLSKRASMGAAQGMVSPRLV